MKKSLLEIYALAVCFMAVTSFVIAGGIAAYGLLGVVAPDFTMSSWEYSRHQSNEAFYANRREGRPPTDSKTGEPLSDEEQTKQRLRSYQVTQSGEQRASAQSLVRASFMLGIALVVFILHWRLARRERASAA